MRRRRLHEKQGPCWDGYERVPGTKEYEKGSCRKKGSKKNEADELTEEDETLEEVRRTIRSILMEKKKKGLWDNIHAKNKRIKAGSGEKKAQPGDDDYPATLDVNETEEMDELAEGLWDNIRKKRARGERPARPGEKGYPSEKAWKETTAEGEEISGTMTEVDEYDENAFIAKAADAKAKGKKKFKMGDKEYDVTIDKDTAEEITGEKIEEARLRKMIRRILLEACYDGRKVTLNKPMSNPENKNKKSKVYVSGDGTYKSGPCKGQKKAKKVQFGDPNMRIKKSNPKARKSFRARHNCDNPGPKDKARYWSCKAW